jgi:hypothetical protein
MIWQDVLDLRALEYRINQEDDALDALEDRVRILEEAVRQIQFGFAALAIGGGECDSPVSIRVAGCSGLPISGAFVTSISPSSGEAISQGYTDADGLITLCGTLADGNVIVTAKSPPYASQSKFIALPSATITTFQLGINSGYDMAPLVVIDPPTGFGTQALGFAYALNGGFHEDPGAGLALSYEGSGYDGYTDVPNVVIGGDDLGNFAHGYAILGRLAPKNG